MMRTPESRPRSRGTRSPPSPDAARRCTIIPVAGIGEIRPGRRARPTLIADRGRAQDTPLADGDCLVVTQKVVSKAEGRLVAARPRRPRRPPPRSSSRSRCASCAAAATSSSARRAHGFVCANAGIDLSNVDDGLRRAAARSTPTARRKHIRDALRARGRRRGRGRSSPTRSAAPWRHGLTDVAIGVSGIAAVVDLRGEHRRARPRAAGHRGRDRRRDRGGGRARDGQGVGRPGRDRARPRRRRGSATGSCRELDPPAARRPVPMTSTRRPGVPRGAALDPRVHRRAGRRATTLDALVEAACLAPRRTTRGRGGSSSSTPTPAKQALADGMGARWRADLAGDGVDPARDRRARRRVARASSPARRRSCSAASPGTASTATPTRPASGPSGAWRCCRSAPRSRTSCSPRPTPASRRAGSRRRSSAPRRTRRARAPRRVAPARARARRPPRPGLRRPRAPAGPARRAPRRSASADVASAAPARWPLKCSSVRPTPSSSVVHGFQPRWIPARPGSSALRSQLARHAAGRSAPARLKPGERAPSTS